ncbi:MAG: right-handed parallel beta-helix repeat-containing protein, partial [Verrucomicrobiae bacterium]|nr:right-handed parallel beta-helix repeat-containing protein [Verrucomicrobiae bacterium]
MATFPSPRIFRFLPLTLALWLPHAWSHAEQDIPSQIPGLAELPDVSGDLQARIEANDGFLNLEPGVHRITKGLTIDLTKFPNGGVRAAGGKATLVMEGAGPAIRLAGSHEGSADPKSFNPATWNEASPVVADITILGHHPEADGVELFQCVQPIINKVSIRGCRHGIHLATRNRNVLISECQIFENEGIGIFYDDVNLHQSNITHCHISYNRQGGVVVRDGNVRNLQITGCDIEANMPGDPDTPADHIANVLLDVSTSDGDKSKSIAEVSITGCTIQHSANYGADAEKTVAPGGANIRFLGKEVYPIDSVAITGNVLSDTTTNVHLQYSTDITLSGNTFFAPKPDQLIVTHSKRITVTGNTFNPREFERPGALRFVDSSDCVVSACSIFDAKSREGA